MQGAENNGRYKKRGPAQEVTTLNEHLYNTPPGGVDLEIDHVGYISRPLATPHSK